MKRFQKKWVWLLIPVLAIVVGLGIVYSAEDGSIQVESVESIQLLADPFPTLRQAPDGETFKHWKDGERDISLSEYNSQVHISEMFTPEILGSTFINYEQIELDEETTVIYYEQRLGDGGASDARNIQYIGWSKKTTSGLNYRSFRFSCVGQYSKEELIKIVQSVTYKNEKMVAVNLPDHIKQLSEH